MTRDERLPLCPSCASGNQHRAHCLTYPITCLDMRDLWDEAVEQERSRIETRWARLVKNLQRPITSADVLGIVRGEP